MMGLEKSARVYLIPTVLSEEGSSVEETVPDYVLEAVKRCDIFFVENERTSRRWLKKRWREMVIDQYQWITIHKAEAEVLKAFKKAIGEGKIIGILSEAGCPGIADPGQLLVAAAQELNCPVVPLVGPSSILLAMMASGLNGQLFKFRGYLPIDAAARQKAIKSMELEIHRENCTQIFIETPYRNLSLLKDLMNTLSGNIKLCIGKDITGGQEYIKTRPVSEWKKIDLPDLHKIPCIFLLGA
jgi:16S rRNA (cytidine1402-2'-O)-methyltransferase